MEPWDDARPAAAARHPGAQQGRRGQALPGPGPAGRRGPDDAAGAEPGHPPGGAVVPGRGARGRRPGAAAQPLRRPGRRRAAQGARCGRPSASRSAGRGRHVKQSGGHGQFAICEIEVEPLPRRLGHRVRRQGRRRRGAAAVHPVRGEGRTRPGRARASPPATRSSTSGSRCSTARRTRWTPPTPRSRRRARSRCARPRPTARIHLLEPVAEVTVLVARRLRGPGDERPVGAARPGRRHRAGRRRAHAGTGRGARDRDRPVRGRSAVALARHRAVQPRVRPARTDAAADRRARSAKQAGRTARS